MAVERNRLRLLCAMVAVPLVGIAVSEPAAASSKSKSKDKTKDKTKDKDKYADSSRDGGSPTGGYQRVSEPAAAALIGAGVAAAVAAHKIAKHNKPSS